MGDLDPDGPAPAGSGLFGLKTPEEEARVHVLPVPFDATTSYRPGAAHGPAAVLAASRQVELFDLEVGRPYEAGIHMLATDPRILAWNGEARACVEALRDGGDEERRERANAIGGDLNVLVRERTEASLERDRLVALLGGDHSTSFGAIEACARQHPGLGILHFDAHADLRDAYEGLTWSHASILFNVIQRLDVARLVQVGVRDLGERERERIERSEGRIHTLFDREWAQARLEGRDLRALVRATLEHLPREIYLSFDVDGLDPTLCPGTGTPVPGGLGWAEAMLWLEELTRSGRRVVGLDLVEVSPGPEPDPRGESWDANVGARLLYRLIGTALRNR